MRCASAASEYEELSSVISFRKLTMCRFFRLKHIFRISTYQDKRMWKNNSISLIDSEIKIIVWLTENLIIISIDTESAKIKAVSKKFSSQEIWRDEFISQLYQTLVMQMREKRFWQKFQIQKKINSRENHFWFDIDFDKIEFNLNQINQISQMTAKAQKQFLNFKNIDVLAHHFIVTHFHFELETVFKRIKNQYSDANYILCDLKHSHLTYEVLFNWLSRNSVKFYLNDHLISERIENDFFVDRNKNFCKRVEFQITETKLLISLKL